MATTLCTILMPLSPSGPLGNMAGKLAQQTGHHAANQSGQDGNRKSDDAVAVLEALLRERDLIIARQERVMRERTRQLDVLCDELARAATQLSDQQTSLEDRAQRLQQVEQTLVKHKTWLSGYDANLIFLENQIANRDLTVQELKAEVARPHKIVNRLTPSTAADTQSFSTT